MRRKYTAILGSGQQICVEGVDLRRREGCFEVVDEVGTGREIGVAMFPEADVRGIFSGEIGQQESSSPPQKTSAE